MRVILDKSVPVGVQSALTGHEVTTASKVGLDTVKNGVLLRAAARDYDVFVTCDQNIPREHRLSQLNLSIVIIDTNRWPTIKADLGRITQAVNRVAEGEVVVVTYPKTPLQRRRFIKP